ncbi:hypothetical protein, partial [Burkholderia stagnalis]|uniref:hypothetical protein n=1 Tax=Burkholderia stagnalis TaxID=1503054 RepID=UPI00163B5DD0
ILADANGLKGSDELRPGQLLTVPNKVTNVHNTSTTFKPYDPGKAIGDTQPTLPAPPPPPGPGGCGGFLSIIAIVVAVVVTAVTLGTSSPVTGPMAAGAAGGAAAGGGAAAAGGVAAGAAAAGASGAAIAGSVGVGLAAGAAGAMAGQLVMIAGGEQHGFNWKGIALSALGSGLTAGMGAALGAPAGALSAAAQGAARSVVTQGIGVVTGLQDRFDWKGVAASAIAAGVGFEAGRAISSSVSGMDPTMGRFITGVGSGLAAGAASTLVRGGSLSRDFGAIAADAVASTVGNMVADRMQSASATKTTATPMHPDDAQFLGALTGAIEKYGNAPSLYAGAQFAGPGALGPVRELGLLPAIEVRSNTAWIDGGSVAYGPGYAGEPSARTSSGLGFGDKVDLNAVAFRSSMSDTGTDIRLAQTDGGFWRGLAGDPRNVFEAPAPLSEKLGAGVRAVGEFIADPFIEVGNQYRDVFSAASGATGGWRSALARQVSDGSFGGAALTEFGTVAGTVPVAGAALRGIGLAAPAALETFGPNIERFIERTTPGFRTYVVENSGVGTNYSAAIGRIESEGHAVVRHGGAVTDKDLFVRATTGVAPDGSVVLDRKSGLAVIPPSSTAFNSDALLARADFIIRDGYLDRAVAFIPPGADRVVIEGVNVGGATGRGFERVSRVPGVVGPLRYDNGLSRATGIYQYDAMSGLWKTVTIYPVK